MLGAWCTAGGVVKHTRAWSIVLFITYAPVHKKQTSTTRRRWWELHVRWVLGEKHQPKVCSGSYCIMHQGIMQDMMSCGDIGTGAASVADVETKCLVHSTLSYTGPTRLHHSMNAAELV